MSANREFSPPDVDAGECQSELLGSFLRSAAFMALLTAVAVGGLYYLYYLMSTGRMEHFPLVCGAVGLE